MKLRLIYAHGLRTGIQKTDQKVKNMIYKKAVRKI